MTNKTKSEIILIRSKSKQGFRRGGIHFGPQFQPVDASELTGDQKEAIEQELERGKKSNLILKEAPKKTETKGKQ